MALIKGSKDKPEIDVVILGSGIAGSALGAVLARAGVRVLILDAGKHPRFAVGESTIPYTSMLVRLVSERYEVPEIKWLATFERLQDRISPTSGIKRNFGFLYHREGETQDFSESHQFPISRITHVENHLFRQDVDQWMLGVALDYGAQVKEETRISGIDFDDDGGTLTDTDGNTYRARYVVDASGFRSPIAEKLDLRDKPTRLRHHARSLFTHMENVTPYDELIPRRAHKQPTRWHQGTLHHVFEGGWLWVIPFNNHARATNPLVSVGLSLDPRVHPDFDGTPEEEFQAFIDRFPDIRKQFTEARTIRPWVSTPRLQYSSHTTVGPRWCLTSHASGFVDALFSRGLSNTFEIINALAWRLIDAVHEDDFSMERFAYVERLEQGLLDYNDNLVANAYSSFRDFGLWDAWFRVWSAAQMLSTLEINRAYAHFLESRDTADLAHHAELAPMGAIPDYKSAQLFFANASSLVRGVEEGGDDPAEAAAAIMAELREADFLPPSFGLADPASRNVNITPGRAIKALRWASKTAPPEVSSLVKDGATLLLRKRFSRQETDVLGEIKHLVATWPVIGRPLRSPIAR